MLPMQPKSNKPADERQDRCLGGKINPSVEAPNAGNKVVLGTATIWLGPEPTQIIGLI